MIIYKDIFTDAEIISDSYELIDVNNAVWEVNCAMITLGAVQVNTGANASAEGADEDLEDGAVKVNNVVHSFQLQQTWFTKDSYKSHLKQYMKQVKDALSLQFPKDAEKLKKEIAIFEADALSYAKKILKSFNDYFFYVGEGDIKTKPKEETNENKADEVQITEKMVVIMGYRDDEITPYVAVWKHGLRGEKV